MNITKTEKLQAAMEVLSCHGLLTECFLENNVQPDQAEAMIKRLTTVSDEHNAQVKAAKIENILQQMAIAGLSVEELVSHKPAKKKYRQGENKVFAIVEGVEVKTRGSIPKEVKERGYVSRKDIPEQYLVA